MISQLSHSTVIEDCQAFRVFSSTTSYGGAGTFSTVFVWIWVTETENLEETKRKQWKTRHRPPHTDERNTPPDATITFASSPWWSVLLFLLLMQCHCHPLLHSEQWPAAFTSLAACVWPLFQFIPLFLQQDCVPPLWVLNDASHCPHCTAFTNLHCHQQHLKQEPPLLPLTIVSATGASAAPFDNFVIWTLPVFRC